jgi:sugar phosphate permease
MSVAEGKLGKERARMFLLAYLTYGAYYLARLNLSVALPSMALELEYSKVVWGVMGGSFSAVYGIGQIVNGRLAEHLGAKKVITAGLLLSAFSNILFGFAKTAEAMVILWTVNGYAQSTGWPSVVKIVSELMDRSLIGKAGGIFGTCFLVGSTFSLLFSGCIVSRFGWRAAFTFPSILITLHAFLFYICEGRWKTASKKAERDPPDEPIKGSIFTIEVIFIVAAYVSLQFVRSGFGFWAPAYIFEVHRTTLEYASYGAAIIPLGGLTGAIFSGWISDRFFAHRRTTVIFAMTMFLSFILLALHLSVNVEFAAKVILLFFGGLALYGPHVMLSTILPIDYGGRYGAANMAGLIDGMGYLGTTIADPLVGLVIDSMGWNGATIFWTASSICATSLSYALWRIERKKVQLL